MDLVNSIESKEYHYKDVLTRQDSKTVGFIAQQVREHMPNAIQFEKKYIPSQYKHIFKPNWYRIIGSDGKFKYKVNFGNIVKDEHSTGNFKFFVSEDISGGESEVILTIEDDGSFIFDKGYNFVMLYGEEVNDFHTIDKNKIYQLYHPCIQELSRRNDKVVNENAELKQRIDQLEEMVQQLIETVNTINS